MSTRRGFEYNREAWNTQVAKKDRWTIPVDVEAIARARLGELSILLTPAKPVPAAWFPEPLAGTKVLCLASGGGQQGPLLAAAGASVTVLDASPAQLEQDRSVAGREGLDLELVLGDMADLSRFAAETFDWIFHPCSNCFAEDIRPVWRECHRVLKPGGLLLAGFVNPVVFQADAAALREGKVIIKYSAPYSDFDHLDDPEIEKLRAAGEPLVFAHSLEAQLGGQLEAGFTLTALYEDVLGDPAIDAVMPGTIATRALKRHRAGS